MNGLRRIEQAMFILLAAALAWVYRDTPAVALALVAGIAAVAVYRRALAILFPGLVAAVVFGAGAGTLAARFALLSLVMALWHIDGLRTKGVVYTDDPVPLLRRHAIWFTGVLLASLAVVLLGVNLVLDLPGLAAVLLVPAVIVVTARLAVSRPDAG